MNRTPTDYAALIASLGLTSSSTENAEIAATVLTAHDRSTAGPTVERPALTLGDLLTIGAEAVHALDQLQEAYARREHGAVAKDTAIRRIASMVHVCRTRPLIVYKPAEQRDPTADEIAQHLREQVRAAAHWRGDHIPTETDPTPPHGTERPASELCMHPQPGGRLRCTLDLGHEGDHRPFIDSPATWPR